MFVKFVKKIFFILVVIAWQQNIISQNEDDRASFHSAQGDDEVDSHLSFHTADDDTADELRSAQGDSDNNFATIFEKNEIDKSNENFLLTAENLKKLEEEHDQKTYPLTEKNIETRRLKLKASFENLEKERVNNPEARIKLDRNHAVSIGNNDNKGYHTVSVSEALSGKADKKAIENRMLGRKGFSFKSLISEIDTKLKQESLSDSEKETLRKAKEALEKEFKKEQKIIQEHGDLRNDIELVENQRVVKAEKIAFFRNFRMKYHIFTPDKNTKSLSEALSGKADQRAIDNRMLGVHSADEENEDDDLVSYKTAVSKSEQQRADDISNQQSKVNKLAQKIEQARVSDTTPEVTEKPDTAWYNLTGKAKNILKTGMEKFNFITHTTLNRNKKVAQDTKNLNFNTRSLKEAITGKVDNLAVKNRMLGKNILNDREKLNELDVRIEKQQKKLNEYREEPGSARMQHNLETEIKRLQKNKQDISDFLKEARILNENATSFENDRVNKNVSTKFFRNTRVALGLLSPDSESKSFSESLRGKADQKAINNRILSKNKKIDLNFTDKDSDDTKNDLPTHSAESLEKERQDVLEKIKKGEQKRLDDLSGASEQRSIFDLSGRVGDTFGKYTKGLTFFRNWKIKNGEDVSANTRSLSEVLSGKPDDQSIENVISGKGDSVDRNVNNDRDSFHKNVKEFEDHRVLNAEKTVLFRNWRLKNNILKPDENTRSFSESYAQRADRSAIEHRILGRNNEQQQEFNQTHEEVE